MHFRLKGKPAHNNRKNQGFLFPKSQWEPQQVNKDYSGYEIVTVLEFLASLLKMCQICYEIINEILNTIYQYFQVI